MYADFAQKYNKMHVTVKSLIERDKTKEQRIRDLENKIKSLESATKKDTEISMNEVVKRLVNVEVENNKEQEKTTKEMKCENLRLQEEINGLDKQISKLDDAYRSIKGIVDDNTSGLEKTKMTIMRIQDKKAENIPTKERLLSESSKALPNNDINCRVCDKTFTNKSELVNHIKTKHNRTGECRLCEKRFSTNYQLEIHLQEHGSSKKYKCEQCDKAFHFKWRLGKHMKIHSEHKSIRACHFFNNGKLCPFEEVGCKFLHIKSIDCKYKDKCRFDRCQFRH